MMILWFSLLGIGIVVFFKGLEILLDRSERRMREIDAEIEDKLREKAGL